MQKTTLATSLFEQLGGEEHVAYLVHDCYYRDSSHLPLEERAAINFDHPESLETDLMIQHIRKLKEGQAAEVPQYDFSTHSRKVESKVMQPRKIILVEGILIFCYPELGTSTTAG
jgi:uridine kinase